MALPPKRSSQYEKVVVGEFIEGEISDIEYDYNHTFSYKGTEKKGPAIRLIFKLNGYKYLHRTRWMAFNLGRKIKSVQEIYHETCFKCSQRYVF